MLLYKPRTKDCAWPGFLGQLIKGNAEQKQRSAGIKELRTPGPPRGTRQPRKVRLSSSHLCAGNTGRGFEPRAPSWRIRTVATTAVFKKLSTHFSS